MSFRLPSRTTAISENGIGDLGTLAAFAVLAARVVLAVAAPGRHVFFVFDVPSLLFRNQLQRPAVDLSGPAKEQAAYTVVGIARSRIGQQALVRLIAEKLALPAPCPRTVVRADLLWPEVDHDRLKDLSALSLVLLQADDAADQLVHANNYALKWSLHQELHLVLRLTRAARH